MLRVAKTLALVLMLVLGLLVAYAYSGLYDVAALSPDGPVLRWAAVTLRNHSIAARSRDISPPSLTDPKMVAEGFEHYHEMCVACHLAPGVESSEMREGLNPKPPLLAEAVPHRTPAELFWIIKNGIKMSGMPAWGPSHDDGMIWAMVAFLEKLPGMTPAEYRTLEQEFKDVDVEHEHPALPSPHPGHAKP